MRKFSLSLMAALVTMMATISCAPERELFADVTVNEDAAVRSVEAR